MLEKFIEQEGNPEMIQLSGGKPTIHPDIIRIIKEVQKSGIPSVAINTNSLKLAHDKRFQEALGCLEKKPIIYLQFDGFKNETYEKLRGKKDLLNDKLKSIKTARKLGLKVVLAVTVQRGKNEDELGDIVKFAKDTPVICGINFQPTIYVSRHPNFNPLNRMTNADVINLICKQAGLLEPSDFVPVPCCYPNCQYVTYVYHDRENWIPFPRLINVEVMLASGVNHLAALEILTRSTSNVYFSLIIHFMIENMRVGCTVTQSFREALIFPAFVINMASVGEETGDLDSLLLRVADFYEAEIDYLLINLTSVLEPFLLIGMGLIVGVIVVGLFLPLYSVLEFLR